MKQKRNENCSCGSGKKYKVCHGRTDKLSSNTVYLVLGGIAAAFIFLYFGVSDSGPENKSVSRSLILPYSNKVSSRPSGEAPPGKIWSEAHGHWHDAPKQGSGPINNNHHSFTPSSKADKNNPPPGMIWSEDHGHFHEDTRKRSVPTKITPKRVNTSEKKIN